MPPQKIEIFKSMENWAEQNILIHLKPVEKCWQPQDFLPDPASDGFHDQVKELRERAKEIPDDYFVALVGDMITLLPICKARASMIKMAQIALKVGNLNNRTLYIGFG